jgi:hypothetical protein
MIMKTMLRLVAGFAAVFCAGIGTQIRAEEDVEKDSWNKEPIIGMYVHQHWSYKHPYAARTWTIEDWQGYLDGLKRIGYNSVLIWPVLETMPDPLTPSDQESLERIAKVIDFAHSQLEMRVFIALCPNVVAKDDEARKYTHQERPFFYCDKRINPADEVAMLKMIEWREKLLFPLKEADGVFIIDSDPGGYPGSNNQEFVDLLVAHRTMFNKLNPNIELYYWIHAGWEAYCRYYETADFAMGELPEIQDTIRLLAQPNPEPWGLASGRGPHVADEFGMASRVISYRYGAIEGEPSFPMTNYNTEFAYIAGKDPGERGTLGNSQTHCVQLPNAFLFARGALQQSMPIQRDYIDFANKLIPGHGEAIVAAWEALNITDPEKIRASVSALEPLMNIELEMGELKGLLFGNGKRFVKDLILMLQTRLTLEDFYTTARLDPSSKVTGQTMLAFVDAISAWQNQHGYRNCLVWPRLEETLLIIDPTFYREFLAQRSYKGEGSTPFEQVQNGYKMVESFTPRLITAMKESAERIVRSGKP